MSMFEAFGLLAKVGAAKRSGAKLRVFDWDKALRIIRQNPDKDYRAGLSGDYSATCGGIWEDGKPIRDGYAYLTSLWATPVLCWDAEGEDCWLYVDDSPYGDSSHWPNIPEEETDAD